MHQLLIIRAQEIERHGTEEAKNKKKIRTKIKMSKLIIIEEFLFVPRLLLKFFGILSIRTNGELVFRGGILFFIAVINMLIIIVCEIVYIYFSCTGNIHFNFQEICFNFLCLSYMLWSLLKVSPLITKKHEICILLTEMRAIHPKSKSNQNDYKIIYCIESMKKVMLHYTCILVTTASGYSAIPLIDVMITYINDGEWKMDFAYFIWYPFNAYKSGIFEICYLTQFYDAVCTCFFILGGDLFMFGILSQIFMHYEYLKREFLSLDFEQTKNEFNFKLKNLLKLHVKINK